MTIFSTLTAPLLPHAQVALQGVFQTVNGAAQRAFSGLDRFVGRPEVEPRVGALLHGLAMGTHPEKLLSSYPTRLRVRLESLLRPGIEVDGVPLNRLERGEYAVRHVALSSLIAPLLGGFLYSANPSGIRLDPAHVVTMTRRYFDLLERDAARAGTVYPRSLLRVAFADLEGRRVLDATYETRRRMMKAIRRREGYLKGRTDLDVSKWPSYFLHLFHWRDWFDADSAMSWDSMTEILFAGVYGAMQRAALPPALGALVEAELQRPPDRRLETFRVVEVGAGTGTFARYFLETRDWRGRFRNLEYDFVEISPRNLELARRRLASFEGAVRFWDFEATGAMAEDLPQKNGSVDVVVAINLFHELPSPVRRKAAAEIGRVLRPGGRFVFYDSVQRGDGIDTLLAAFGEGGHGKAERIGTFHEPYIPGYATEDLDALFGDAGLRRIGPVDYAYLAKGMVFRKD